MQLTGAEIICECLLEQGVDTVFGYPGGAALNTYDALYKYSDKIRHILTAHEQGASHAADGYARATGKTGVVMTTSGPGATNIVTGLATANIDSIPLVAITGNVTTDQLGRDSFQEVDIVNIVKPVTKASFLVEKVEDLADTIRKAFALAQHGRKGPVLVDVPKDVTANKTEFVQTIPERPRTFEIRNPEKVRVVQEMIKNAKELPTHSVLLSVKWRVRQSVMFATHSKLLTESSGQSPMTLTKTRVLTIKNSANLPPKRQ